MGLSKEKLLSVVSEEQIWQRVFGDFKLSKLYKSPIRNEKSPSFNIYQGANGRLLFKDFGGIQGDVFDFIMKRDNVSFTMAINIVAEMFGVNESSESVNIRRYNYDIQYVDIGIRKKFTWEEKPFPEFGEQIDFWLKYGITKPILDEYKVRNISWYSYIANNEVKKRESKPFNPIFLFNHNADAQRFYTPNTKIKALKWAGNTMAFDVFGIEQITYKQDVVGILAGQKDCLSLYSNSGIRCVSLQSESTELTGDVYEQIREKADKVFVLYDNDQAGKFYSRKISEKFGIKEIDISTITQVKDVSDYYEKLHKSEVYDDRIEKLISQTIL